jgi:DNA-binding SARP family transcriptional activator
MSTLERWASRPSPIPRSTGIAVRLIDGFAVTVDGREHHIPAPCQRVLAFLALRERSTHRLLVAGALWPDQTDARATANLRAALWRINQVVGRAIEASRTDLRVAPHVRVDVRELMSVVDEMTGVAPRQRHIIRLRDLLEGALLPGWYDDWVTEHREQIRLVQLHALEVWTERLIDAGHVDDAVHVAALAASTEPLRESAQRALILAHLAGGNRSEAIRLYRRHADLVRSELGAAPSRQLAVLVDEG